MTPKIKLSGKVLQAPRPTMEAWFQISEFDEKDKAEMSLSDFLDGCLAILSIIYKEDKDVLKEGMDVADVIPAYREAAAWVISLAYEKLGAVKNAEAVSGENTST